MDASQGNTLSADPGLYRILADLVLSLHFAIVLFVIAGLPAILVGNYRSWRWVNTWWFRIAHLAAIAIVVAGSWLEIVCPLTMLEGWLREQAGAAPYTASFIEHWVQRLLYYEAPPWVFTLAYSLFGLAVAAAWWAFPPRRTR